MIEALHWSEAVREAKASIHSELATASVFGEERRARRDCADARLDALAAAIIASPPQWHPLPTVYCGLAHDNVYIGVWRPWPTEVWRTIEAAGLVPHFDAAYRRQAAFTFDFIREMGDLSHQESLLAPELRPLSYPIVLTPDGKLSLLRTIAALREINDRLARYTEQMNGQIAELGETPTAAELKTGRAAIPYLFTGAGVIRNMPPGAKTIF